jgi:hypothetical protein
LEFKHIDFSPCRDPFDPNGWRDGAITPTEMLFIQKIGESSGDGLPDDPVLGDCYYCGGSD